MSTSTSTTTESRALELLGKGIPPAAVAAALGVDPSRITQLLSDDTFAASVVEKKFESLSKHATRDMAIDQLEDHLLDKLKDTLPFMTRPMEILKSFSVINAAKRRTLSHTDQVTTQQTIVTLNIPSIIVQKFSQNIHNQVTAVGQQSLVTMQSSSLLSQHPKSSPTLIEQAPLIKHLMEKPNVERTETTTPVGASSQDVSTGQTESQAPVRATARIVDAFPSH